jgi:hypothetical protein
VRQGSVRRGLGTRRVLLTIVGASHQAIEANIDPRRFAFGYAICRALALSKRTEERV